MMGTTLKSHSSTISNMLPGSLNIRLGNTGKMVLKVLVPVLNGVNVVQISSGVNIDLPQPCRIRAGMVLS